MGIKNIVSLVTDKNGELIAFHLENGFTSVGKLKGVAVKFGKSVGVIFLIKRLN